MHPGQHAATHPDRAAIVVEPSGRTVTYRELEEGSNRFAHLLRARGLGPGSRVAILAENRAEYLVLAWGAQRAGAYYTGINRHLTEGEVRYILADSGAQLLVASDTLARSGVDGGVDLPAGRLALGDAQNGWESYEHAVAALPGTPIADETEGDCLLYSSGTTGRPKGVVRELPGGPFGSYPDPAGQWLRGLLDLRPGDVYLSPGPLYHAAPLAWSMAVHRSGGTVVVLERFDAELALAAIERHRVTHSQWVATMFVRMLKLPGEVRARYDLTSHRHAVHGAAPCPVEVKRAMIEWWGPILFEYYSMTEAVGATSITSEEWLRKPGSVGRPLLGTPVVLDEHGREVPSGTVGTIWFRDGLSFTYHGDPGTTAASVDEVAGRASVGDVGYLDEDGYLYLSDRRDHLIISGGVNIYPQEIEDALVLHPKVLDVAVIGVPDPEMGERVVAVVQPADPADAGRAEAGLAEELRTYARERLAGYKVPREIRLAAELPRTPTGKLRKHLLRESVV